MATNYFVIGSSEDVTTCDCCGKSGLKKTIVLGTIANGERDYEPCYFGSTCAENHVKHNSKKVANIKAAFKNKNSVRLVTDIQGATFLLECGEGFAANAINCENGDTLNYSETIEIINNTNWSDKEEVLKRYA